jgi:hypothetical protein
MQTWFHLLPTLVQARGGGQRGSLARWQNGLHRSGGGARTAAAAAPARSRAPPAARPHDPVTSYCGKRAMGFQPCCELKAVLP